MVASVERRERKRARVDDFKRSSDGWSWESAKRVQWQFLLVVRWSGFGGCLSFASLCDGNGLRKRWRRSAAEQFVGVGTWKLRAVRSGLGSRQPPGVNVAAINVAHKSRGTVVNGRRNECVSVDAWRETAIANNIHKLPVKGWHGSMVMWTWCCSLASRSPHGTRSSSVADPTEYLPRRPWRGQAQNLDQSRKQRKIRCGPATQGKQQLQASPDTCIIYLNKLQYLHVLLLFCLKHCRPVSKIEFSSTLYSTARAFHRQVVSLCSRSWSFFWWYPHTEK